MEDFDAYLKTYCEPIHVVKSDSGEDVYYTAPYSDKSRIIPYDRAFGIAKPFSINDIKDMDSLFRVVRETCHYAGSKVLGKSEFVAQSDNVIDSSVVFRSAIILRSSYIAYSSLLRDSRYIFGGTSFGVSGFCMSCCQTNLSQRCFETNIVLYSSDVYYSNDCKSCHEAMFCFDQRSKNYIIGNNQLEKSNYAKIKAALIEQFAEELEKKKKLPSLKEVILRGI